MDIQNVEKIKAIPETDQGLVGFCTRSSTVGGSLKDYLALMVRLRLWRGEMRNKMIHIIIMIFEKQFDINIIRFNCRILFLEKYT